MAVVSPAVLTSSAADNHLNTVVKPTLADVTAGMQTQAQQKTTTTTPATTGTTSAPSTTPGAPLNTYSYIGNDGTNKTIQASNPTEAMSKAPDIAAHSGVQLVPPTPPTETTTLPTTSPTPTTPSTVPLTTTTVGGVDYAAADRAALKQAQDAFQSQATSVQQTISDIQSGAIPLNTGEQAQVDGLRQQFQTLIEQQKLENIGATGLGNIRGYQTGAAEYDPTFQVKTIGSIVTAGNNKVADLNIKMASAVAGLIQGFKTADIGAVKDAWNLYQTASKERTDALQKTIDDTQKAIADAQAAKQKQTDAINAVAQELAKNGAPVSVINAATNAGSVAAAIQAGTGYFQDPTSIGGQYSQYVRNAQAQGLTPMSAADFVIQQKSREAYATEAAKAAFAGGGANQQKLFNQGVSTLKSELSNRSGGLGLQDAKVNQAVHLKNLFDQYKVVKQVPNPFHIGSDPFGTHTEVTYNIPPAVYTELAIGVANLVSNSNTVAEGTINNIKQATAKGDLGKALTYATGEPFNGSSQQILSQLKDSVDRQATTAEQLRNTYVDDLIQRLPPDLSPQNRAALVNSAKLNSYYTPKEQVDNYVQANPEQADAVAKLYEVPGVTDQDVIDYLNQAK